jgi:hypothetical protein
MKSLDCQHCGAKLAFDGDSVPDEVRCRRCGRRTSTATAKPARRGSKPPEPHAPTVAHAEPIPESPPIGSFGTYGNERRVPPEDVQGALRPRPDFFREDSIIRTNRGTLAVVIGGVAGVLLAAGLSIALIFDWGSNPRRSSSGPYIGERERVVVAADTPATSDPAAQQRGDPQTSPPQPRTDRPPAPPRPAPPAGPPPAPAQAATLADAIDVSTALCKRDVFVASEIALREFERKFRAEPPSIDLRNVLEAAKDEKQNAFDLLEDIRGMDAGHWMEMNRPTLRLQLKSSLKRPVKATIRVGLKDTFARSLFNGGVSSASDSAIEWRDDGTAQLPFYLSLDQAKIYELKSPVTVNLEFVVEYEDKSREAPIPHEIRVHPVNYIELGYPFDYSFATMVDEDHPIVKDLVNKISGSSFCKRTGITMGGGGVDLRALFAVWRELKARGIRYSSIVMTSTPDVQEVRSLQECLLGADQGHANCADGSVLLASIYQKIDASPHLVSIPGHMFLMFPFEGVRGGWLGLETTMLAREGVPGKEWLEFCRDLTGIPDFEKRLTASERAQWLSFLAALQEGTSKVIMCAHAIFEGLPKDPNRGTYSEGIASAKDNLTALDAATKRYDAAAAEGDREQAAQEMADYWVILRFGYLSFCHITEARSNGVKPIGHDPKSLPKDLAGPLKAP